MFFKDSFYLVVSLVRAVSFGFVNLRLDVMRSRISQHWFGA